MPEGYRSMYDNAYTRDVIYPGDGKYDSMNNVNLIVTKEHKWDEQEGCWRRGNGTSERPYAYRPTRRERQEELNKVASDDYGWDRVEQRWYKRC